MKPLRNIFLFIVLLLIPTTFWAQNLVPNPSFEDTIQCENYTIIDGFITGWTNPNDYSPDYFNSCANINYPHIGTPSNGYGYQEARTGNAYCGIYIPVRSGNSLREYIQAELTEPLIAGEEYIVKFYVSLADNFSDYAVNTIGAYFSTSAISSTTNTVFNVTPQIINAAIANPLTDKDNWQEITGNFVALGGEKFITIGNFEDDNTVDTTNLVANITNDSYYYIDDVSVEAISGSTSINELNLDNLFSYYPNPADNVLNIKLKDPGNYSIKILDIIVNSVVYQENINSSFHSINVNNYPDGIYFLQLIQENNLLKTKTIIINH